MNEETSEESHQTEGSGASPSQTDSASERSDSAGASRGGSDCRETQESGGPLPGKLESVCQGQPWRMMKPQKSQMNQWNKNNYLKTLRGSILHTVLVLHCIKLLSNK